MRALWKKILWRSIPVAIILGAMGYVFAEIFLMLVKMNGGINDPANNAVRWRTPLTMAALGVVVQIVVEFIAFAIGRSRAKPTIDNNSKTPLPNSDAVLR
jgi:hypothetical protein